MWETNAIWAKWSFEELCHDLQCSLCSLRPPLRGIISWFCTQNKEDSAFFLFAFPLSRKSLFLESHPPVCEALFEHDWPAFSSVLLLFGVIFCQESRINAGSWDLPLLFVMLHEFTLGKGHSGVPSCCQFWFGLIIMWTYSVPGDITVLCSSSEGIPFFFNISIFGASLRASLGLCF